MVRTWIPNPLDSSENDSRSAHLPLCCSCYGRCRGSWRPCPRPRPYRFPGWWAFGSFVVIACVLRDVKHSAPCAGARVPPPSSCISPRRCCLVGSGVGIVAGVSTLLGEVLQGIMLSRLSSTLLRESPRSSPRRSFTRRWAESYRQLTSRPESRFSSDVLQRDLGLFFVFATMYFLVNSALVSSVVSTSSDRAFREVWSLNTRGVLGYDLGASIASLLVAWLYTSVQRWLGFGPIGLIGVIFPVVAVRHVYGLYHQLQDSGQELLQLMVKAIEARDPYTSGHSVRVSRALKGYRS